MINRVYPALLAGAAMACWAMAPGVASADPLYGTYTFDIYQGTGNGSSTAPIEQANLANPLFGTALVAAVTYTGALNFNPASNTLGAFFASGGGSFSGLGSAAGNLLSTSGFAFTTLFSITGVSPGSISGTIDHDDGETLYQFGNAVSSSASPTSDIPTAFSLAAGAFNLVYVEANGLPAVLDVDTVPEPASFAVLAIGLAGLYSLRRTKRA